jgi:hypothetical protein
MPLVATQELKVTSFRRAKVTRTGDIQQPVFEQPCHYATRFRLRKSLSRFIAREIFQLSAPKSRRNIAPIPTMLTAAQESDIEPFGACPIIEHQRSDDPNLFESAARSSLVRLQPWSGNVMTRLSKPPKL